MSAIDILDEILSSKYLYDENELKEINYGHNRREIVNSYKIYSSSAGTLRVYRFENNCFPYFSNVRGLKRMCDFVVFWEFEDVLYINLIELKDGIASCKPQLMASRTFIEYIINSCNRIGYAIEDYQIKMLRLSNTKINKMATKGYMKPEYLPFDEDDYADYNTKTIHLKYINKL